VAIRPDDRTDAGAWKTEADIVKNADMTIAGAKILHAENI